MTTTQRQFARDLFITLSYLFAPEKGRRPALATVGEVKVPTARNILIGTGQADFTTHLIDSKRFGRFDTHANVGYTYNYQSDYYS